MSRNQPTPAVSELIRNKDLAEPVGQAQSREDWKKQKELEEARKVSFLRIGRSAYLLFDKMSE